jgi:hypothetical protein
MKRKKQNSPLLIGSIIIVGIVIGVLLVWFLICSPRADDNNGDEDFFDPSAITGILPNMSEEEIQAELDRVVQEGMLNISISSGITFNDGKSKGMANIYNVEANKYIFKVGIVLDDSNETVYESKGIRPGQYIQYIELDKDLDAGEYPATAVFTAYTQEDHKVVGNAAAQVVLYVNE